MLPPRWRKVLADLGAHASRTLIVVLSIAVGVFGVGFVAGAYVMIKRSISVDYLAARPASATMLVTPFGEDLVRAIRRLPEIGDAEGKTRMFGRVRVGDGEWRTLVIFALHDFKHVRVDVVIPETGPWPPPKRELLLERQAAEMLGVANGDFVTVETPDGKKHAVRVAGTAHDVTHVSGKLSRMALAYVTFDTLKWLGRPISYNTLDFVVSKGAADEAHIRAVAADLRDHHIEMGDRKVLSTSVPSPPRKHPLDRMIQTALFIFFSLGFLAMFLSGFLVVNTIESLLASQIRQIGIMKAVGGRAGQITAIYLAMVLLYGVLGLAVGLPSAALAARLITAWLGGLFNFDVVDFSIPPVVIAIEVSVGLVIPLAAALYPILKGTRVSPRIAMDGARREHHRAAARRSNPLVERPSHLPRQLLLSLRNTFRHKGRLALTLVTLTLGGAIFIAVMSVRASLLRTIDVMAMNWQYDASVSFATPYAQRSLVRYALAEPGVDYAEGWNNKNAVRKRPDGTEIEDISMIAPPADTRFITPSMVSGRWLRNGDTDEIVVNKDFLRSETDVHVGSVVTLKIEGIEHDWTVVGVNAGELRGSLIYANHAGAAQILREAGQVNRLVVATKDHAPAEQRRVARALEEDLKKLGYDVAATDTNAEIRSRITYQFNILVVFLLIMAIILATVGGLGLAGTMSINVLERTREVAVMRAIGASDGAILGTFMTEGVIVGVLGCFFGTLVSIPLSRVLSDTIGTQFFGSPLSYTFSPEGALLWLGIALVLAVLASAVPSRRASQISVNDALAYE
jgi:putative ABC transport system permease protein